MRFTSQVFLYVVPCLFIRQLRHSGTTEDSYGSEHREDSLLQFAFNHYFFHFYYRDHAFWTRHLPHSVGQEKETLGRRNSYLGKGSFWHESSSN
jgi:hypothetical protein